jgi:hypothetical protein
MWRVLQGCERHHPRLVIARDDRSAIVPTVSKAVDRLTGSSNVPQVFVSIGFLKPA